MKYTTELPFSFNGVEGEMKIVYTPFSLKVYQNGRLLKRKGIFTPKYEVNTNSGGTDYIKLSRGIDFAYAVEFRGEKKHLEDKLTPIEYIIGLLPILLIFLGGVIGAVIGILGTTLNYNFMRQEKNIVIQILVSVVISFICYLIYFLLALLLNILLYGMVR